MLPEGPMSPNPRRRNEFNQSHRCLTVPEKGQLPTSYSTDFSTRGRTLTTKSGSDINRHSNSTSRYDFK